MIKKLKMCLSILLTIAILLSCDLFSAVKVVMAAEKEDIEITVDKNTINTKDANQVINGKIETDEKASVGYSVYSELDEGKVSAKGKADVTGDNFKIDDLKLKPGKNKIKITAKDNEGNKNTKNITVNYDNGTTYKVDGDSVVKDEESGISYVKNIIIVTFKDNVSEEKKAEVVSHLNGTIVGSINILDQYQIRIKDSTLEELKNICEDVKNTYKDIVMNASYDSISEVKSVIPNDPWSGNENWDEDKVEGNNWGLEAVQALSAWDYNNILKESEDTINVGVVDAGFDVNNRDFPEKYKKFDCGIDLPVDHGTFVTNIIAGKANNKKDATGLLWNPGTVYCASTVVGEDNYTTDSSLFKGMTDVIEAGAKVVNCSFGSRLEDVENAENTAIMMAKFINKKYDFLFVQASGNESHDARNAGFFAGITDDILDKISNEYNISKEEITNRYIVVGAADLLDDNTFIQADYSNGGDAVDICAPGSAVYSVYADDNYGMGYGTSFSAPHVTAIAAMTWRANPKLTAAEVKKIVCDSKNTIYDVPDNPNSPLASGDFRMVNAKLSVEDALSTRDDLVTIYYKGNENSKVEYYFDNNSDDKSEIEMVNSNDIKGFNKKIVIALNKYKSLNVKFSDNNEKDYSLKAGTYTISDGKINEINSLFNHTIINSFTTDTNGVSTLSKEVTLTAKANNENGNEEFKFSVIDSEGNKEVIKDFSKEKSVKWNPSKEGKYSLVLDMKKSDSTIESKTISYVVNPKPYITESNFDRVSPSLTGKEIDISVRMAGGTGENTVNFYVEGGNYHEGSKKVNLDINPNSDGSSAIWIPEVSGNYSVYANVTDSTGITNTIFLKSFVIEEVESNPITINNFTLSKYKDIEVGENIDLNISIMGGQPYSFYLNGKNGLGYKYSIVAKDEYGNEEIIVDKDNYKYCFVDESFNTKWTPSHDGKWTIIVTAEDKDKTISRSEEINVNKYTKNNSSFAVPYFESDRPSPVTVDTPINLRAESVNGVGEVTYEFKAKYEDGSETVINANNNKATWTPSKAGKYTVTVTAKDSNNNSSSSTKDFVINKGIEILSFECDKSEVNVGDIINVSAKAEGGTGKLMYEFYYSIGSSGGEIQKSYDNHLKLTCNYLSDFNIGVRVYEEDGYSRSVSKEIPIKVISPDKILGIDNIYASNGNIYTNKEKKFAISLIQEMDDIKYSAYAENSKGERIKLIENSDNHIFSWTPKEAGYWMIFAYAVDKNGNKEYKQRDFYVEDSSFLEQTTIYYKGYDNPNIHYKIGNGSWTEAPGIKMEKCNNLEGYTHKITIDLKDEETLTACFNDGQGHWDSANGANYQFGKGIYTYSNGTINKVGNGEIQAISLVTDKDTVELGDSIKINANVIGGHGKVKYNIIASLDLQNGYNKDFNLVKGSNDNTYEWTPSEAGIWTILVTAYDECGNADGMYKYISVVEKSKNVATIYYKGFENPNIHYKIGNGSWTEVPGIPMKKSSAVDGYDYEITIDLNNENSLTACFNDGHGNWDSNYGNNYTFNKGTYTYSNGKITKLSDE